MTNYYLNFHVREYACNINIVFIVLSILFYMLFNEEILSFLNRTNHIFAFHLCYEGILYFILLIIMHGIFIIINNFLFFLKKKNYSNIKHFDVL